MPKPFFELRSFLRRTLAFVSPAGHGRGVSRTQGLGLRPAGHVIEDDLSTKPRARDRRWRLPGLSRDRTAVALSVEGSSLRILTTARDRIVGWSSVPIADRAGSKGRINDPAALGSLIDAAFEEQQLSRGHVSWALPGIGVTTRIIHLPNVPTHRLRETVVEEFDRVLDGAIDEYYLFWERLSGMVRPGTVFALAVPKSTVLPALESLEFAGIRPRTMDLRPIALARAVGQFDSVVANLEEGSIDVIMIERGVPVTIHSVPILGASVTRDAAQARLLEETERVLADYEDSNPDYPFSVDAPIYLTGSWATGIALSDRLRYATRRPIGQLRPAVPYPPELPVAEYAVTLGLSLKRK